MSQCVQMLCSRGNSGQWVIPVIRSCAVVKTHAFEVKFVALHCGPTGDTDFHLPGSDYYMYLRPGVSIDAICNVS